MIRYIEVTNHLGESISLELAAPEKSGFIITNISGLDPSTADINVTDTASGDGSMFNSARLENRNIVLSLTYMGEEIETIRRKSYKYFPVKKQIKLRVVSDTRDCYIYGHVESNDAQIFSSAGSSEISIICPDPYFRDSNGEASSIFYGTSPLFEFPFENDSLTEKKLEMGQINRVTEANVYYDGDSDTGITIYVNAIGDASGLAIYNTNTREEMKIDSTKLKTLTGSDIKNGDEIIICTVKRRKSIRLLRDGTYTNILNTLGKNIDWFQLQKGDNLFMYTATSGLNNLRFRIQNEIIYDGV